MRIKVKSYKTLVANYGYAWQERRWSVEISDHPGFKRCGFVKWDDAVRSGLFMLHHIQVIQQYDLSSFLKESA